MKIAMYSTDGLSWWVWVLSALLLSGCTESNVITKTSAGSYIWQNPIKIFYSPESEGHQTITLAQACNTLPRLIIDDHMQLNGNFIIQVQIWRTGRIQISSLKESFVFSLNDINLDVAKMPNYYNSTYFFVMNLTNKAQIYLNGSGSDSKRFADALYVLKHAVIDSNNDTDFFETAHVYHVTNPKPELPEEARKFKIQAEGAVQEKNFFEAADSYSEALKIAPWWPAGHFNLALVWGETGVFIEAEREMKRYLQLIPDAPNARAAQDKIYSWEREDKIYSWNRKKNDPDFK